MKAVSPKSAVKFICSFEEKLKKEDQTVFTLKQLSAEQESVIDNNLGYQSTLGYVLTLGTSNMLALHFGLMSVQNLTDDKGNDVKIERDNKLAKLVGGIYPIKMSVIDMIPQEARDEIATEIKKGAKLGEKERKNS